MELKKSSARVPIVGIVATLLTYWLHSSALWADDLRQGQASHFNKQGRLQKSAGRKPTAGTPHTSHNPLPAPEITVPQLFSEVLIDSDDYDGWEVRGKGLGELAVWTRPNSGDGNGGARKEHLAKAQEDETQRGRKILVHPVTQTPILLAEGNKGFLDEKLAAELNLDGRAVFYEYLFEPVAIHSEGKPISFYLIHKTLDKKYKSANNNTKTSNKSEWAHEYSVKGAQLKSQGLYEKAIEFLNKAIQAGDANASVELGQMYETGAGLEQDFTRASQTYQLAAAHGSPRAHELLSRPGFSDFVELWHEAMGEHSLSGSEVQRVSSPRAELKLAVFYATGNPWLEVDSMKASHHFEKNIDWASKEADKGDVDAQFALGMMFAEGYGVQQDLKKATVLLKAAVAKGHGSAKGYLYDLGNIEKRANRLLKKLGIHLVKVEPKHDFMMGSPDGEESRSSSETHHKVVLSPYEIQDAAVTQGLYVEMIGENPSHFKEKKYCPKDYKEAQVRGKLIPLCGGHPVESVSWDDANSFIQELNKRFKTLGYSFSLPSEAQQEDSFRGGTPTAYVSGEDELGLDDFVWYSANANGQTHPVKSKKPNHYGVYRSLSE